MNPKKLVRKVLPDQGIKLAEETYRRGRIMSLQAMFGFPARGMRVIAVTGTDGKTTTCCFINEVLKAAGQTTALYTTAVIEIKGESRPNTTHRTLPLTEQLLRFLREARKADVDFVVLEVTSQALHQHKLRGIPVEMAVMTNLTQDHLDYHGTIKQYATAKAQLFNGYMKPDYCILNADDEWYDFFLMQSIGQVVSYGQGPDSTERIKNVRQRVDGSSWQLVNGPHTLELDIHLSGLFNVYNASAAAAVGLTLDLKPQAIAKGLAALKLVPGRMQSVDVGQDFTVWVDYAVTPEALARVLEAARQVSKGKVSVVFGATGERDKTKRPLMGEAAATLADRVFLTDDETYTEDPETIRQAVYKGIKQAKGEKKTQVIADRREAIQAALKAAKTGDVVILTGIGHQTSRNMGGHDEPWDEVAITKKLLQK